LTVDRKELEFLLSHFKAPTVPRRYSTQATGDAQYVAETVDEMIKKFEEAKNVDCKVNAYNYLDASRATPPPSPLGRSSSSNDDNGNRNGHHIDDKNIYNNYTPVPAQSLNERIEEAAKLIQAKALSEQAPTILFIDLDEKKALPKTRARIKDVFMDDSLEPTVIDSGNGFHLLLVLETDPAKYPAPLDGDYYATENDLIPGRTLQSARTLALCFDNNPANVSPGGTLLKCASEILTNKKADKSNHPSVKSVMVRVPGSYNSKLLARGEQKEVSIVSRGSWGDGQRKGHIMFLLPYHAGYIRELKKTRIRMLVQARNKRRRIERNNTAFYSQTEVINNKGGALSAVYFHHHYWYIDLLLQVQLDDFRKRAISLLLAPYLLRIKQMPYEVAEKRILQWLSICDKVRYLDFDAVEKTEQALSYARDMEYKPLELENIPKYDSGLHAKLLRLQENFATGGGN